MVYDLDLEEGLLSYSIATPPVFVYGNTARSITLGLNRLGTPYILTAPWTILFTLRDPSDFNGEPLAQTSAFTLTNPAGPYRAKINLFTENLEEFIGNSAQKECLLQVTVIETGGSESCNAVPAIIQNYTANPNSGSPTPLPDPALVWLEGLAVLYAQAQSLNTAQQVQAQGNIGIVWDNDDGVFVIQTPNGVRFVAASS